MDILLVDDDQVFLHEVKDALESGGYSVFAAADGIEGCKILVEQDIDLILSDVRMPGFDGVKLYNFVREMTRYKHKRFVFFSTFEEDSRRIRDADLERNYYLSKFTPPTTVVKFVDKLLFGKYAGTWM
ncbi:MAG: response regulator [Bacteroidota bacterium]